MKEWEIGIIDNHPSTWKRVRPLWDDEKIVASSKDSFLELMTKLCKTAIASRREHENDSGITDHLWKLTIKSYEDTVDPRSPFERNMMRAMGSDDESDDSDDDEEGYHGTCVIRCPQDNPFGHGDMDDEDDPIEFSSDSKLDAGIFPVGSIMKVHYDYGSTTELYLKVLSVKSTAVRSLLQYFSLEAKVSDYIKKMKKVPAYNLPKEKQIDHFYPNFSRAFLGFHVPLFKKKTSSDKKKSSTKAISSATMGLSSCIRSEDDTTFCSMVNRTSSSDLLFFPGRFEINELLQTGEKAWEPVDPKEDKNNLDHFRYDSIARWGIPPGDDKSYDRISKMRDEMGQWGPKMLLFQLAKEREEPEFQFEKVFPKTYEMLQCGKFRWFQYKNGVLRVIVGRGVGHDHRGFESDQILSSWKYDFESFHELLCALEASWMWKGKQMTADTLIPKFDTDLGPSKPMPKEAEHVASTKDAVVVSRCQDKRKLVTALAVSEDPDGKPVLYSGHDDGVLTKWSLEDNKEMWSKQIYSDQVDEWGHRCSYFFSMKDTPGVAGLAVRPDPKQIGRHLLYTWTNGEDRDKPHSLKVWSGTDGSFVRKHFVHIGDDDKGNRACPDISTVVFCPLLVNGRLVDSVLVGLHCICSVLDDCECYTRHTLETYQEHSEGNILPFFEHPTDGRGSMDSWRGHRGMIQAMAVIQGRFLLSYSIQPGHGFPDAMILWSLHEPGIPLFRKDLWDPSRSMFKQSKTRLHSVCGLSVSGYDVLFADEDGFRVATVRVEEDGQFDLEGYAQTGPVGQQRSEAFHGRMAMSQSFAAVVNETDSTVWIYKTEGVAEHPKLDSEDGNWRDFDDNDPQSGPEKWTGREIAVAQVEIPKFGGNAPSRKRQKRESLFGDSISILSDSYEEGIGCLGKGGPVTLAMRGRNLITAFSNGTIVKTPLPDRFNERPDSVSANHLASCSALASDVWHHPMLDFEE